MKKELTIVVIILLLIIILNIITQKYTDTTMDEIIDELQELRIDIIEENENIIKENIENVIAKWDKKKEILVIYLEHTELEKVEMYILETKSYIETGEYTMATQSLDICNFIIKHIKDKYEFSWQNIF